MQALCPDFLRSVTYYLREFKDILSISTVCKHFRGAIFNDSKQRAFIWHLPELTSHPERKTKPKYWLLHFYSYQNVYTPDIYYLSMACMFGFDLYVKDNIKKLRYDARCSQYIYLLMRLSVRYEQIEILDYLLSLQYREEDIIENMNEILQDACRCDNCDVIGIILKRRQEFGRFAPGFCIYDQMLSGLPIERFPMLLAFGLVIHDSQYATVHDRPELLEYLRSNGAMEY